VQIPSLRIPALFELDPNDVNMSKFEWLFDEGYIPDSDEERSIENVKFRLEIDPPSYSPRERLLEEDLRSDSSEYEPSSSEISQNSTKTNVCSVNDNQTDFDREKKCSLDEDENTQKLLRSDEDNFDNPVEGCECTTRQPPIYHSSSSSSENSERNVMDYSLWKFFDTQSSSNSSSEEAVLYDLLTGGIKSTNRCGTNGFYITQIGSVIDMLQLISDYLDDKRAAFWIDFGEENSPIDTSNIDIDELVDELEEVSDPFELVALEIFQSSNWMYPMPRAIKLLTTAAKKFIVDVLARAQLLEKNCDALQPDTLIEAANQMMFTPSEFFARLTSDESPAKNITIDIDNNRHSDISIK